jgi:hypothetical protein
MSDHDENVQSRADQANSLGEGVKRVRRVARTLESFDLQRLDLIKRLASQEQSKSNEKLEVPRVEAAPRSGKSRVAKTVLFNESKENIVGPGEETAPTPPPVPRKNAKELLTRTKLFTAIPSMSDSSESLSDDSLTGLTAVQGSRKRRPSQQFIAKTRLDHSVIIQARSHFTIKENERLQQEISERSLQPVKIIEPIESQKKVTGCPFAWQDEAGKERFKVCTRCNRTLYNFDGIDEEQARAVIFQRENRKQYSLYKREDGKFMTSDCPVAVKHRHQLISVVATCVCLIALVSAFVLTMPPPPPPAKDVAPDETERTVLAPSSKSKSKARLQSRRASSAAAASFHYHAGDPVPEVEETPKTDAAEPAQKNYSDSEEKGDFWQFTNGDSARGYRPGQ